MRRIVSTALMLASVAAIGVPRGSEAAAPAKVALDYKAYDAWKAIRGTKLSDDGNWIAYALVPEDGDSTLVIRDLTTGKEFTAERGLSPAFTPDSQWVVYAIRAKNDDIHLAEREHKPAAEQPKNGLGVMSLVDGHVAKYERVKSVKLPHDPGATTIAILLEPSPSPKPSAEVSASPRASATPMVRRTPIIIEEPALEPPTAAPSPSPTPDDLHKIEPGTTLLIRELDTTVGLDVENVSEVDVSHDGRYVAYATEAKNSKRDGLHVLTRGSENVWNAFSEQGHYKNVTFAPKTESLAFVSDHATFGDKAPRYALYHVDLSMFAAKADTLTQLVPAAHAATAGMPRGWAPSVNATLAYSRDGRRLFLGTAPAPTPVPSGTPEPMKVDLWSWRDGDVQPYQKVNADKERKRSYTAVVRLDDGGFSQLASPSMRDVVVSENSETALGDDDLPYRKLISWEGQLYVDAYAVSLRDGKRRLLVRKIPDDNVMLSPDGRFVVTYDPYKRDWYSLRTSDGKRSELTAALRVAFYDELSDQPRPPDPYGFAGWVDGGKYALVRDRYDLWAIEPASGKAWMLTGGAGRATHVRFDTLPYAADRDSYDSNRPLPLFAFNDDTKGSGLYVARFGGPSAQRLRKIMMVPKYVANFQLARKSERYVVTEQRFDEAQNLWSAPSLTAWPTRISDANPQQTHYLWGSAQLISYRSTWGAPLHGILLEPENFNPHKKYPMLVYFYERFSDLLHHPPFTIPSPYTSPDLVRYVSNGYVVLIPDVAYQVGHPGKSALGCVLPAVDEVVKRGFVDNARIGVAGHSWAAYQIAYMITQTNRFRAAEAGAAVADMISAYGGIRWGSGLVREFQYEHTQSRIGSTPWDRPDLYLENSALFHIKNIHTPYLTIANDADEDVPWYQGIEFLTALRRLGKEAYMFEFDGESHNLRGREQQKYWTVHLDEFFDHFLKGAPEPDWMKNGVPYVHRGERDVRPLYGEKP